MNYELIVMLKPTLSEDQSKKALTTVVDTLKSLSAKEIKEDPWGKKKLAYEISGFQDAYYAQVDFASTSEHIKKLSQKLNLNEDVIRYLVSKKGK